MHEFRHVTLPANKPQKQKNNERNYTRSPNKKGFNPYQLNPFNKILFLNNFRIIHICY